MFETSNGTCSMNNSTLNQSKHTGGEDGMPMFYTPLYIQSTFSELQNFNISELYQYKRYFISDCGMLKILGRAGTVFWSFSNCSDNSILNIQVPSGMFIEVHVELKGFVRKPWTPSATLVEVDDKWPMSLNYDDALESTAAPYFHAIFTSTNNLYLKGMVQEIQPQQAFFILQFQSIHSNMKNVLPIICTSAISGYMMSPGFDGLRFSPSSLNSERSLHVPANHRVMVSFQRLHILEYIRDSSVQLFTKSQNDTLVLAWKRMDQKNLTAEVYTTNLIVIKFTAEIHALGFKMFFSFHPTNLIPQKAMNGLFNCSVDFYDTFREHLDCNLEQECVAGEDEAKHCKFSSDKCAGKVASHNKCYFHTDLAESEKLKPEEPTVSSPRISNKCQQLGSNLAVIRTKSELDDFEKIFSHGKNLLDKCIFKIGITYGDRSLPDLYRLMWSGVERTVLYDVPPVRTITDNKFVSNGMFNGERACLFYYPVLSGPGHFRWDNDCEESFSSCGLICEQYFGDSFSSGKVNLQTLSRNISTTLGGTIYVLCHLKHITHQFLQHDHRAKCGFNDSKQFFSFLTIKLKLTDHYDLEDAMESAPTVQVFECGDRAWIHYSLVCDFREDCLDQSDEVFCRHVPCPEAKCRSGQCVSAGVRCDRRSDCIDGSDEEDCKGYSEYFINLNVKADFPAIIKFNQHGFFTLEQMQLNDSCPETHYRCVSQPGYCLPAYTRCNGYFDCLDHEDEKECEDSTCPGFYRCLGSTVCLHTDHLCDGWPQCPERDDEWLCTERPCPESCLCDGLAFVCRNHFSSRLYPQLRYLNASRSGMTLGDVGSNVYLILLILDDCKLQHLPPVHLPNLRYLSLKYNQLQTVDTAVFLEMVNLRTIYLSHNPLTHLHCGMNGSIKHKFLHHFDLSYTRLEEFSSHPFSEFLTLTSLNLSNSHLHTISDVGFRHIPALSVLDLTGNPIKVFSVDVFAQVANLVKVSSDNYKLCCPEILPPYFNPRGCSAPQNEVSSCQDLLHSEIYRTFLWLVCILSFTGNLFSLIFRAQMQKKANKLAFNVLVSGLNAADLMMAFYIVIIGAADIASRGRYLHFDVTWLGSVPCKVAGFLSLASIEASALMILLVTVDRCIVLRFPFTSFRFGCHSALLACLVTWAASLLLAAVPLLPVTSHWEFYRQTSICIPLPVTRHEFKGRAYSAGLLIVLNFFLFLIVAAGQAFIYWSVHHNSLKTETTRRSQEAVVARRLIAVALTDFLCWFPVGLCGLLALAGVPIPGEINVALAIFVLPLNSALNPFLYTFNVVVEKRRKVQEKKLLKMLESKILLNSET